MLRSQVFGRYGAGCLAAAESGVPTPRGRAPGRRGASERASRCSAHIDALAHEFMAKHLARRTMRRLRRKRVSEKCLSPN